MICKLIEEKLKSAFLPSYLDVTNESCRHSIPYNLESHFKVVLVSNHFISKHLLMRHRMVYRVLSKELLVNIHALALHTFTIKEWVKQQGKTPDSPKCYRA